tara:strand:+ start:362 stop:1006 length:645 start_codon:yes stop_codon:yes gene_type:complete
MPFKMNPGRGKSQAYKEIPSSFKQDKDAMDGGDKVPNYNETKGTSTPSTATTTSSKGKSYSDAYNDADKTKYPTLASFTKAAKEYNANNPSKPTPSTTTSSETKNIKIGKNTPNSVQSTAVNTLQNTKNKLVATTEARKLARKKDSANIANKVIKRRATKNGKLTEKDMTDAQTAGDKGAIRRGVIANQQGNLGRSTESIMDIVKSISEKPSLN